MVGWGKSKESFHRSQDKMTMTIKTAMILVLQDKSLLKYNKQSIQVAFQTDLSNLVHQKSSQHKENTVGSPTTELPQKDTQTRPLPKSLKLYY